jgi:hypothetical protein
VQTVEIKKNKQVILLKFSFVKWLHQKINKVSVMVPPIQVRWLSSLPDLNLIPVITTIITPFRTKNKKNFHAFPNEKQEKFSRLSERKTRKIFTPFQTKKSTKFFHAVQNKKFICLLPSSSPLFHRINPSNHLHYSFLHLTFLTQNRRSREGFALPASPRNELLTSYPDLNLIPDTGENSLMSCSRAFSSFDLVNRVKLMSIFSGSEDLSRT